MLSRGEEQKSAGEQSVCWVYSAHSTANQSINQSINQPINQSINHSITQLVNQSINQKKGTVITVRDNSLFVGFIQFPFTNQLMVKQIN